MRSVLVVDDDDDIRNMFAEVLSDEGYLVHAAANGKDALDWLLDHPGEASAVVLDLMMPVMDGESFLRSKADKPSVAEVPVVVVTAQRGRCPALSSYSCVRECVGKPLRVEQLVNAVANASR